MSEIKKPAWFERAINAEPEWGNVVVDRCPIRYAVWGERGKPGIVLIHGSNAHLEWWRFVAPFLADQFRVAAFDLSGNGDSGWRDLYSGELFAKETWAVCEDAGLGEFPFVVGHSFGGFVALETGHCFSSELGGIIFADFTIGSPEDHNEWGRKHRKESDGEGWIRPGPTRVYEDFDVALGRFRLMPEQDCQHPYVIDYVARQSLHQVEGGWTWKFDPALFGELEMGSSQRDKFLGLKCRSAVIMGEYSRDGGAQSAPYMREISKGILPIFTIPTTHHHFMFDEPMAVVTAIKGIVLAWIQEAYADELVKAYQAVPR